MVPYIVAACVTRCFINDCLSLCTQLGILLGLGLTPFIVHTDADLQLAVCGNATLAPTASPQEKQEWSEFIYTRLLYFNIGVAVLGLIIYVLTLVGKSLRIAVVLFMF